jgi:rhamnogalacturonan endolyase
MREQFKLGCISLAALCALSACGGGGTTDGQAAAPKFLAESTAVASSFGVAEDSDYLTVDTGAGLVFKVKKSNGDIKSIHYKGGPELQDQAKGSHISSGIGAAVSYTVSDSIAKITLTTPTLTHYLVVRAGENNIYMGTFVTAEPSVGELRWITRLNGSVFTQVPEESNLRGSIGNVESKDVFLMPDGTTRSKYYGNQRAIDLAVRGVSGDGVGAYMVYGNRESSSGGPFFRDIQNQSGTDSEVYNYMNSGHNQTGKWRMGFHGPYALMFTDGAAPAKAPNMAWMESLDLAGWVPSSVRGRIVGRGLDGFDTEHQYTVGFENDDAQYWTVAKAPNGHFNSPDMKPGTYTMTVYKDEIAVYTESVHVARGATIPLAPRLLQGDPDKTPALWRIGTWDGTPLEFLNGKTINLRHPSDVRNPSWGPVTYAVGAPSDLFPAAQWKSAANSPTTVTFTLTPEQIADHTIRIGLTAAYNGGRAQIKVNGWTSPIPSPSSQPKSRSLTIGTYRGNNVMYTYQVPASAFVAGTNTMTINVVSGTAGTGFLSPGYAYDALDLL